VSFTVFFLLLALAAARARLSWSLLVASGVPGGGLSGTRTSSADSSSPARDHFIVPRLPSRRDVLGDGDHLG
jgi:hypothetical protein